MATNKKAPTSTTKTPTTRKKRIVAFVSDEEDRLIENYLKKYKIKNKSNWMRETLLAFIYKNLDEDYPTLFNEHDMRR
jgi:hypothetical protein